MRWLSSHVGRRGAFLSFLALLDFVYGYSLLTADAASQRRLDLLLPWSAWGIIWLVVGVSCASGIFIRLDRYQYVAAATIKWVWGSLYVDLWLSQHVPRAWVSAVIWIAFGLIVLLVSGWPEPSPKLPPLPPELESSHHE